MPTNDAQELKPCPFCGGTPTIRSGKPSDEWYAIECRDCFALSMRSERMDWAIDAWNTRAMPDCVRELVKVADDFLGSDDPLIAAVKEHYDAE